MKWHFVTQIGHVQTMQERLRDAKRELDTKDAHVDLLRKKLVSLESEQTLKVRSDFVECRARKQVEQDWEELMEKNKKLAKQYDKLVRQYEESQATLKALKSESVENKTLRVRSLTIYFISNCLVGKRRNEARIT